MTDRTDYMAEQRAKALARRNEFWAEMMKPLMPSERTP